MLALLLLACSTPSPGPAPSQPPAQDDHVVWGTDGAVEAAFAPAWAASSAGEAAEADRLASEVVRRIEAADAGFALANAHATQGRLRATMGDHVRARVSLEKAVSIAPVTEPERTSHLEHRAMLVDVLLLLGEATRAVTAAREALAERIAFYPDADHPGRAYGHRGLASALLAAGEVGEAESEARRALEIFQETDHFDRHDALLLLGQIQVAAGKPVVLPPVEIDETRLREAVSLRLQMAGADHLVPVLTGLLVTHPSEGLHGMRAGLAWQAGDISAARDSAAWLRGNGSPQARLEAGLLLARLDEQEGRRAEAEKVFVETCSAASGALKARCQRELGLFLAEDPERTEAAREALRAAGKADDPEISGRALAALGILEAHEGQDEARPSLEAALRVLPPTHPDAVFARNHLRALGTGACGCEAPQRSLEETLQGYADSSLPGLVRAVSVDADGGVEIELTREASAEEQAQLADLQERVIAELGYRNDPIRGE